MRILITRPAHDAARTAERLKARGHEGVIDALITIEPLPFEPVSGAFDAVAVTSANALRAMGPKLPAALRSLPLFAVGAQSAEAAREAGFGKVSVGKGDVLALAKTVADELPSGARVLYLAGSERAHDLAEMLTHEEIKTETRIAYRAVPATRLHENTCALLRSGGIDAVLHYSPRSAEIFLALVTKAGLVSGARGIRHLCLSDAVAAPLARAGFEVRAAARPEEDALFALLD